MKLLNPEYLILVHGYEFIPSDEGGGGTFSGVVKISHSFDRKTRLLHRGNKILNTFCERDYKVRISLGMKERLVKLVIVDEKALNRGEENHIYQNWECCLCAPQDLQILANAPAGFDVRDFYESIVIPFFYNQTYRIEHPGVWILGEYSHGDVGVLERYANEPNPSDDFFIVTMTALSEYGIRQVLRQSPLNIRYTPQALKAVDSLRQKIKKGLPFNLH